MIQSTSIFQESLSHRSSARSVATSVMLFVSLVAIPTPVRGDEIDDRVDRLIAEMSLTEKIGQTALRGDPSRVKGELSDDLKKAVRQGRIGGFLNVMEKSQVEELQRIATEESPHKIPLIF